MGQMCYLFWIMGAGGDWVRGRDRQIGVGDGLLADGGRRLGTMLSLGLNGGRSHWLYIGEA